jgi:hypothetical protein
VDPQQLPVGLIDADHCTHLATRGDAGLEALCGAGPIVRRLPGLWDPTDPIACVNCHRVSKESA